MIESIFVVVGGGIAAISCVEQLIEECPNEPIIILTASNVVKATINWQQKGRALESFDVEEKDARTIFSQYKNVQLIPVLVTGLNSEKKELYTNIGKIVKYRKLCIATGGKAKVICDKNEFVIGIRDTETVKDFQRKLKGAKRILVVGNGGIATELVYEVENVEVIWAIKHKSISATFVDAGAAEFFIPHVCQKKKEKDPVSKRRKYTDADADPIRMGKNKESSEGVAGSALGPDWAEEVDLRGAGVSKGRKVHLEYECEIQKILTPEQKKQTVGLSEHSLPSEFDCDRKSWPIYVELTNGSIYGCDLIVSATGVEPNTGLWLKGNSFALGTDGGLKVNEYFETSISDIYAVGDVCSAGWDCAPHWVQMRLWTQARQMGSYGGLCMAQSLNGNYPTLGICFDIFTHVTTFFGYKVILLGRFNGQGLGPNHEALVRVTKGEEYVKVLVENGRVQGAVLIGETDLEETLENLILNQTDISDIKDGLLDPSVDIEDYFD